MAVSITQRQVERTGCICKAASTLGYRIREVASPDTRRFVWMQKNGVEVAHGPEVPDRRLALYGAASAFAAFANMEAG